MAGFCGKCGSALADGQGFCARCGTPASGSPPRPSSPAPAAAPIPAAAPSKSGSTLLKVLLGFVIVIFIFGAAGLGGLWYVAHRVKQKVHDMGLDQISTETTRTSQAPVLGGSSACSLLSKEDVGQAVKMTVVRAESEDGSMEECTYSVMGDYVDLIAKHTSLLHKSETTDQQKQMMETFAKAIGHNDDAERSAPKHPGEAPVFVFSVDNSSAVAQMSLSRATLGRLGPSLTDMPGIGDDAFDIANAMIMVRKGDKVVHIMYMMCPCTTDDIVPLAKKIVANL